MEQEKEMWHCYFIVHMINSILNNFAEECLELSEKFIVIIDLLNVFNVFKYIYACFTELFYNNILTF